MLMMIQKINSKKEKVTMWRIIRYALKINIRQLPILFILLNALALMHSISYGVTTVITQHFYDSVEQVLTKTNSIRIVYGMIIALGLAYIFKELLHGIHNFMHGVVLTKCDGEIAKIIHQKMSRIDPICLEDTELYDNINKAQEGAGVMMFILNMGIQIITLYIPYFIFMSFYLYSLKPIFVLAFIFVFVPVWVGQMVRTSIISKFEDKAAPIRREYAFYESAIIGREFYKETRILGAYHFFNKRFLNTMKKLSKVEWESNRKTYLLELSTRMLTVAGYVGILYMLIKALLAGEISVGSFAAVFGSIGMFFAFMEEMLIVCIGNMAANLGKACNFIRFINLPERGGKDAVKDLTKGIVVENVSFRYPGANHNSVDNVSIHIKQGETIAIVGENGAGKTTLVRLLMGYYKPTDGKIYLNGADTSEINSETLFNGVSGVFQRFQRYQMTLKDNIHISDISNQTPLNIAVKKASIDIHDRSFPKGYNTMLSREFGGVDLSGGQWQRVAIARGLYRSHDMIVLDEPTASIDPLEESRIYRDFQNITKDKMAIIVTHRLGSTKMVDKVVVMDKGKIISVGTHEFLMVSCTLYRNMFNSQAEWYDLSIQ